MADRSELERVFLEHGLTDFRWIVATDIVVAEWVRFKCTWGCKSFGARANCPPNAPSVDECRRLFEGYNLAAVFHFVKAVSKPEEQYEWTKGLNAMLLGAERSVFLAGYYKTLALYVGSCRLCSECTAIRTECRNKMSSRPVPEALGVDVFTTVRKVGYPIAVLTDPEQEMNRYGFILVE